MSSALYVICLAVTYEYGSRLRYMAISVNLTLDPENLGYPTASPVRDAWEDFASEEVGSIYLFTLYIVKLQQLQNASSLMVIHIRLVKWYLV